MMSDGLILILILVILIVFVMGGKMVYWKMRSDNGYNMGRNHMLDLGFTDEDLERNQDDADKELYIFRKPSKRNDKKQ